MAAGLLSFLTPCCLPLVPAYLAYVSGTAGADAQAGTDRHLSNCADPVAGAGVLAAKRPRLGRTATGTLLFILGFSAVFVSYGAAFGAVGTVLIRHQEPITKVLGAFTILLGIMFAGLLSRIPLFHRPLRLNIRPHVGLASAPLVEGRI